MNKKQIINRAKRTLSTELTALKDLTKILNNNFYKAVSLIHKTKGRVIVTGVGKSAHIGNKIAATLTSTGTPSFFIHATEASHGDLGGIKKNDCIIAISNSGETSELNNIINFSKRFNIPLISISSNSKSSLYKNSTVSILYKKPIEACPLNLAPTSSTTICLVIGDCLAMSLLELKGFKSKQFKNLHPGGNLGKDLKKISEIMHTGKSLPLAVNSEKMSKTLITMTKKSFGCIGVINKQNKLIGIITDGDLRRNMNNNLINKTASDLMTKNPTKAEENLLVSEALNIMNTKKITSLFVCKKNKPIGIVHIHDLLRLTS
ncbi:MAG: Arabinose 5-phosphate isomerase KdsD [Alphaproteobacteria bacterium MarineAlpha5_Bin5]|nr:MAG: Arabinose 5-phosphate isomerase KdsD [Alphaproteobacteria bacterium MarineAlpha5_Bin5]PPR52334.1 MAG: Arabinose 5-phosphate isomerase KdsD [Alphaproteobacteria bacterium MarineAlpha5_Bin4]